MISRRALLLLSVSFAAAPAVAEEGGWSELAKSGTIVLFRHATAPGTGDPPGFVLGDCSTQRNLDDRGRAEARAIGEAFRRRGIAVGGVVSSQWCRSRETAELAFPGQVREEPIFNSFFANRASEPAATAEALRLLSGWQGPGVLVAVTHQVNITALTGIVPRPGEGVIVRMQQGKLSVLGRLKPPQ